MAITVQYAKFCAYQIRSVCMENGRVKYLKNFDRVIEDIFGFKKLGSKIANCHYEREVIAVFSMFGENNCQIFRDSSLYDPLVDLVHMHYDLKRVSAEMAKARRKGRRPRKGDLNFHEKTLKLYRKVIKVLIKRLGLKRQMTKYRDYASASALIKKKRHFEEWSIFDDIDDTEPWGDPYPSAPATDYYEAWMGRRQVAQPSYVRPERYRDPEMETLAEIDEEDEEDLMPEPPLRTVYAQKAPVRRRPAPRPTVGGLGDFVTRLPEHTVSIPPRAQAQIPTAVEDMARITDKLDALIDLLTSSQTRAVVEEPPVGKKPDEWDTMLKKQLTDEEDEEVPEGTLTTEELIQMVNDESTAEPEPEEETPEEPKP